MLRLIAWRLISFVPTLFVASVILFVAVNVVPGSAARSALGIHATPQALKRFEHQHGLDRPLPVQYPGMGRQCTTRRFRDFLSECGSRGPERS